jgi:hypothetical protein
MAYKFSETGKLGDKFQRVFGIGFKPFYDGLMSVASKQLCIDIMKFDEWLHEKHGNYEDAGQSMDDCIREHYGEEGVKLINEVIGADGDNPAPEPESEPEKPKKKPKTKTKGKANVKKITEKMLNEKGSIKFECTDSYGITYEMTLFQMGLVMLGRVLAQDGTLLYHNEQSCEDFEQAQRVWDNVGALLSEADCTFFDVAMMIVYLRDTADYHVVRALYEERFPGKPYIIVHAPVCRPGWLVEMECMAVKRIQKEGVEPF